MRLKLKRNSDSIHRTMLDKENDFNFGNMEVEEGSKTTREQPTNTPDSVLNTSSVFSKAAKRMRPDTV